MSRDQRHQAEEAFAFRDDCVIVATSVLELGVDVGDLDRVIQIDAPLTVASFLQRMGRTGRRPGIGRNCLFLATKEEALLRSAGLIDLWDSGFVEPIVPPALPYHVVAQQLMALALQLGGVGKRDWFDWIRKVPGFAAMAAVDVEHLVASMLDGEILSEDQGQLWLGRQGEDDYGRRNFLELFSVFMSPPLFTVVHGRQEIGFVDESTFLGKVDGPRILLLGGRAWRVNHVDWQRRMGYVEPSEAPGRSRWKGQGQGIGFALCQSIKRVLASDDARPYWSRRAADSIGETRREFPWASATDTAIVTDGDGHSSWWTFAGSRANATLAPALAQELHSRVEHDSFELGFTAQTGTDDIEAAIEKLRSSNIDHLSPEVDEQAIHGLKFSECLPVDLAVAMLTARMRDAASIRAILNEPVRFVTSMI